MRITKDGASIFNPTGTPMWSTMSDRRVKDNIERASYDKCYDNIKKMDLYRFSYIKELNNINKDLMQLGYIAQEVKDIFPKAVSTQEFHNENLSISDMLSIDISQINYTFYGAVKKLIEIDNNKEMRIKMIECLASNLNISELNNNSNIVVDTSNIVVDTSNIVVDTSNIVVDTSNFVVDTSNFVVDTSNIVVDTSNIVVDTNNSNISN
jgi:Flp pilus assembly CpaF family ATPase